MTAANWPECIAFTLSFEGGFDANPKDRGNWTSGVIGKGQLKGTKYGIAAHVYPDLDIKNLTLDEAKAVYRRDYWPKVAGDEQPSGVDLVAWDICVNSGASRALAIEGAALGSTLKTAPMLAERAQQVTDKVGLVKTMCAKRGAFYRSLSTFNTFGKGWLRRNASCEARGVTMALRDKSYADSSIKIALKAEGTKAENSARASGGSAATTGVGSAATAVPSVDFTWPMRFIVAAILLGILGFFVYKFVQHRERAKAYEDAAKGIIGG